MKKIEIIIRPSVFDKVREALSALGVNGMNYQEIKGFGRQHGHVEVYRGTTINVDFLPKVRFEVVTKDESWSALSRLFSMRPEPEGSVTEKFLSRTCRTPYVSARASAETMPFRRHTPQNAVPFV